MAPPGSRLTIGNKYTFIGFRVEDQSWDFQGKRRPLFKIEIRLLDKKGTTIDLNGHENKDQELTLHDVSGLSSKVTPELQKVY